MGNEINLMKNYPKSKRDIKSRGNSKTQIDRKIAREFGKEFFDGNRSQGYGGFNYDPKYWKEVIPDFQKHFNLSSKDSILDVGCAKGFMIFDFERLIPGISVRGVDISNYAIENAKLEVRKKCSVANAKKLPFSDNSFDIVISITTLHNLEIEDLKVSLNEIQRVSKRGSFITLDAYRNEEERIAMESWNLTAKTMLHVDEWKKLFKEVGYEGDYYWFIP